MNTAGSFRARCNLKRYVAERNLNSEEIREAKAKGYPRRFVPLISEKVDRETAQRGRWEYGLPACEGFETTDKAAFDAHMAAEHGRDLRTYARSDSETFSASIRRGWRSPHLSPDGKALTKDADAATRQCPTCELVAEVTTTASDLWWTEHLRGCALAHDEVSA